MDPINFHSIPTTRNPSLAAPEPERKSETHVTFVVPVRNEEQHIRACLQSLVDQSYAGGEIEILVVDGWSSDGTRKIIDGFRRLYPHVHRLENPAGIAPKAMNIGIRAARGDIIIRADGHNVYPRDYAANCVKYLAETPADNVGGPCITVPADESFGGRLVAAVLSSPFGVGNSRFRTGSEEGFVDTVPFGAFRKELFDRIGMYNEKLVRNQDNDLNARIRNWGGQIYLTPALATRYHPVKTFRELLSKTFQSSRWHMVTIRENSKSLSARHLAPACFVLILSALLAASFVAPAARWTLLQAISIYFLAGAYFPLRSRNSDTRAVSLALPFASFCFHLAYGAGTIIGLAYLFREPSARPLRPGLPVKE